MNVRIFFFILLEAKSMSMNFMKVADVGATFDLSHQATNKDNLWCKETLTKATCRFKSVKKK